MPWITAIVPRAVSGAYLSHDRTFVGLASISTLAVAGVFLFDHGNMWAFSIVFALSFLGGAASLYFLNRIPDPASTGQSDTPRGTCVWRDLLPRRRFCPAVELPTVVQLCVLSTGTFITIFARGSAHPGRLHLVEIAPGAALVGIFGLRLTAQPDRRHGQPSLPGRGVLVVETFSITWPGFCWLPIWSRVRASWRHC